MSEVALLGRLAHRCVRVEAVLLWLAM
jgi:hypothetical protein